MSNHRYPITKRRSWTLTSRQLHDKQACAEIIKTFVINTIGRDKKLSVSNFVLYTLLIISYNITDLVRSKTAQDNHFLKPAEFLIPLSWQRLILGFLFEVTTTSKFIPILVMIV